MITSMPTELAWVERMFRRRPSFGGCSPSPPKAGRVPADYPLGHYAITAVGASGDSASTAVTVEECPGIHGTGAGGSGLAFTGVAITGALLWRSEQIRRYHTSGAGVLEEV
jgi:hypothetical protein